MCTKDLATIETTVFYFWSRITLSRLRSWSRFLVIVEKSGLRFWAFVVLVKISEFSDWELGVEGSGGAATTRETLGFWVHHE